ncbi:MAG: hypothetical protein DCC71_24460, partial [Proteobacteria bacterium]
MSGRAREIGFRVAVALLCLALLEGGLRAFGLPEADACWAPKEAYWTPDAELGFAYRPGARVAGGVVNALGLRGPVPARAKPPGTRRVLFVGDSTTWGWGVAEHETYWAIAAQRLAAAGGARVEPLVAAAPGYSSHQSRVLLRRMLAWRPDDVVLLVGAYNDRRRRVYYPDAAIPARMQRRTGAPHRLRAAVAAELAADKLGGWIDRHLRDPHGIARVPPAAFEANVRAMLAATRSAGARALVLVPPYAARRRERPPPAAAYEEILTRLAREHGAPELALAPVLVGCARDELCLPDGIHPDAEGHRRIGDAVAAALGAA